MALLLGIASAVPAPETPPPGANDWDREPTPDTPRPVILVNPTFTTQAVSPIPDAARTLSDLVDRGLAVTGAAEVDPVGHSQDGGITPDYYLKFLGAAEKVHTKVGTSPMTGTTPRTFSFFRSLIPILGPAVHGSLENTIPALTQQVFDSDLARQVYPDSAVGIPGVEMYSVISEHWSAPSTSSPPPTPARWSASPSPPSRPG